MVTSLRKDEKCPGTFVARSSAPVQMSLGIHFCFRSLPKIRQQRKHLLNRSDTVLSCSLSLCLVETSMKFPSKAIVCPSVHFKEFQHSKCKQHSFPVSLFLHIFATYDKKKKKRYKWANLLKPVMNISRSLKSNEKENLKFIFCKSNNRPLFNSINCQLIE